MACCPICGADPCVNPAWCKSCQRADRTAVKRRDRQLVSQIGAATSDELLSVKASDLEMCGLDWLWPGRFARGKFGLIAGLPDMGKGQIAAYITAAVTLRSNCHAMKAPRHKAT